MLLQASKCMLPGMLGYATDQDGRPHRITGVKNYTDVAVQARMQQRINASSKMGLALRLLFAI